MVSPRIERTHLRYLLLAIILATSASRVTLGAPRLQETRKPVDPPEGEWWVEKWEFDGEVLKVREDRVTRLNWSVTLTKNKMVVITSGGPVSSGRRVAYYQTDTVLGFDLSPDLGAADPKTLTKGIWKLEGDTLLFCFGEPGGDRPTDFTAPKDSGRNLYTLKRKPKN
jgi:uncharacterized protein (TIGR03067 family)